MPTPKRCEILCYGPIGSWFGVSAAEVVEELKRNASAEEVVVRVHSDGGDALDGIAICNALRAHGGHKIVMVDGLAGSAASMIAMGADEVVMAESSMMMLHNPWGFAMGDAGAMREQADVLDALTRAYIAGYQRKTGKSEAEVRELMQKNSWINGTWLTAAEAHAAGLADRVGPPVQIQARTIDPSRLRGLPPQAAALYGAAAPPTGAPPMKTDDKVEELVPRAELQAAQARVAELEAQLAQAKPVLAAVAGLTGKQDAAVQVAELAILGSRVASLPTAEELRAGERRDLVAQLRARQVPPVVVKSLEAACDAAGGDLAVLRAAVNNPEIKGLQEHKPAASAEQGGRGDAEPKGGEISLTDDEYRVYQAAGAKTREEAIQMKREGEALARSTRKENG